MGQAFLFNVSGVGTMLVYGYILTKKNENFTKIGGASVALVDIGVGFFCGYV